MNKLNSLNKIISVVINGLLLVVLWAMLFLPASSFSLLKFKENNDVLSGQSVREPVQVDDTKTVRQNNATDRGRYVISETSDSFYIYKYNGNR